VRLAEIAGAERALAVGSGIGGPSRYLAKTHGCHVIGFDITVEFVAVASMLAERTGLADKVRYQQGHALTLNASTLLDPTRPAPSYEPYVQ